jgi:hypothetical protein
MANKRLKKKQQAKQNVKLLTSKGIPKKEAAKIKNRPQLVTQTIKRREKEIKEEQRVKRFRHQADLLESLGFKRSAKQRTWSEKKFNEWYAAEKKRQKQREYQKRYREKKKREREAKKNPPTEIGGVREPLYLLIFWRQKDRNELIDGRELIAEMQHRYKYMDNEWLIQSILGFLTTKEPYPAPIGTSHVTVIPESRRHDYIQFMKHFHEHDESLESINDWNLVYEGKASTRQYHWLLLAIHTMIRLMYDASERADFIGNLIYKFLPKVNPDTAKRLAKDLNYRRK